MKTTIKLLCLSLAILCYSNNTVTAQDLNPENPIYLSVSYMKVKPENRTDYLKMEKAWTKIHKAKLAAGAIKGWSLLEVVSPSGSHVEYNYVTYENLGLNADAAKFLDSPYFPEDWQKLLTKEELALVNRTGELRTLVKNEVWQLRDGMYDDNWMDAKIQVCNFFSLPKGKNGYDHYQVEKKYWMPVHKARIADDKLEGWDISNLYMPFGSDQAYEVATTDVYKDMKQYMAEAEMEAYMKKLHPNKSMDEIFEETRAIGDLIKGEVRQLIDRVN
ncbi:MAG: hypothetical protein AAFO82_19610 [Bacteroidota bacterium]